VEVVAIANACHLAEEATLAVCTRLDVVGAGYTAQVGTVEEPRAGSGGKYEAW
jgi:hypothetical protein